MKLNPPKDSETIKWTQHVKEKMMFYMLSETRVRGVLRRPARIEEGIAPGTTAVMQKSGSKKNPKEIWVMYQKKSPKAKNKEPKQKTEKSGKEFLEALFNKKEKIIIISAWRYPGASPKGKPPIPEDVAAEIEKLL